MKAIRNILLVLTLVVAAVSMVACGNDDNADEESKMNETTSIISTTRDEITSNRDIDTTDRVTSDEGVVGDIVDDVETEIGDLADDVETDMKKAKDNNR